MKAFWLCVLLIGFVITSHTRRTPWNLNPSKKLIVVTIDGFRWQEVFGGADSVMLADLGPASAYLFGGQNAEERRQKLLPFFWSVISGQGQLYGNRKWKNKMDVANPYGLSYPGYNELLTGTVDWTVYNNDKVKNNHTTILEKIHQLPSFRNKVAAFASWNRFPYIFHQRSFHLSAPVQKETRPDTETFSRALEYIKTQQPSVVFLGFSGTDEAGHQHDYAQYLKQAHQADSLLQMLWKALQSMPAYHDQTHIIITTDHGRGHADQWYEHGPFIKGSSETWMAVMGPSMLNTGELKNGQQIYLTHLYPLMMRLLGP